MINSKQFPKCKNVHPAQRREHPGVCRKGMNVVTWTSVCVTGKDRHLFKSQETFQEKATSEIFLQDKSELVVQNREG